CRSTWHATRPSTWAAPSCAIVCGGLRPTGAMTSTRVFSVCGVVREATSPISITRPTASGAWITAYILLGQWVTFPTHNLAIDSRLGYLHLLFPLGYQPTVKPTDLSVADLTLSTLTGAAQNNFLNPAQHWQVASTASY